LETNIKEEIFNSEKYKFLWDNKKLNNNIILLTFGGSHAHGINNKNSDIDLRGITLNSIDEILTMNLRNKPYEFKDKEKKLDTVVYTLMQIVNLLANCNPNTIEILGCKDEHYFILSEEGKILKDNVDIFLSKKVINSFLGYATSQLRRLQNARARDSYPQKEKENHMLNSIKRQLVHFQNHYTKYDKSSLKLYLDKSEKEDFDEEIFVDVVLKHYPLRDFNGMMSEMTNVIRDYNKLNNRNKKKDEEHLMKHVSTLVRLLMMGIEILETKKVNTYREDEKERKLLINIRNEKIGYNEIDEIIDEYEQKFDYASNNTELPDLPDWDKINELMIEINKKVIERSNS